MTVKKYSLLRVHQWLKPWDEGKYTGGDEKKPRPLFYMGSMPISELRAIAGIGRRLIPDRRKSGSVSGYQRAHDATRSESIARYIQYGYPLSTQKGLDPSVHAELIHPGWLPTSIIVNVVGPNESRRRGGRTLTLSEAHAIKIRRDSSSNAVLIVPDFADFDSSKNLEPLEIIDGQHRILAVDEDTRLDGDFEVPVIFFDQLSPNWQAYLFWVINVEPKKINPSLAFDLYPELRSQTWLDRYEPVKVYQEHRSQEISDILWRHELSAWRDRIEILGNRVEGHVSNAAFIRSIAATFIRKWGSNERIGGLYGATDTEGHERVLRWNRAQQSAFLLLIWNSLAQQTKDSDAAWAEACRKSYETLEEQQKRKINPHDLDPAFAGPHTLLATDQGVRAILYVYNAVAQCAYEDATLETWEADFEPENVTSDEAIFATYDALLKKKTIVEFVKAIAACLIDGGFDWRTSSEPLLNKNREAAQMQAAYRGSSGYTVLEKSCIHYVRQCNVVYIADAAERARVLLGWEK